MLKVWTIRNRQGQYIACYRAKNANEAISRLMRDQAQTASTFRKSQPININRNDFVATSED